MWCPPRPPIVKVNFDAAIGRDRACLAVVDSDHAARILFVRTEHVDFLVPFVAESLATLLVVRMTHDTRFKSVVFEGDSSVVIQAIQEILLAMYWSINGIETDVISFRNHSHLQYPFLYFRGFG